MRLLCRRLRNMAKPRLKVRFLKTDVGADDGIHVRRFRAGEEVEIGESLAIQFLHRGSIQLIDDKKDNPSMSAQVVQAPLSNQATKPFFRGKK